MGLGRFGAFFVFGLILAFAVGPQAAQAAPAIVVDEGVPAKVADFAKKRVMRALYLASKESSQASLTLRSLRSVRVALTSPAVRYVGWRAGGRGSKEMVIAMGNFFDKKIHPLVAALAATAKAGDGVDANAPRKTIGGVEFVGGSYSDSNNEAYFKQVQQAMGMAKKLPKRLRGYLSGLDHVRYSPESKDHVAGATGTASSLALYNPGVSEEGRRVVMIMRDLRFGSAASLLRTLVHEAKHAEQHRRVDYYRKQVASLPDGKKKAGMASYIYDWDHRNEVTKNGWSRAMRFECEAFNTEIDVNLALDLPIEQLERSGYFQPCEKQRIRINKIKDRRLTGVR